MATQLREDEEDGNEEEEGRRATEERLEWNHKQRGQIARFSQPPPNLFPLRIGSFCSFSEGESPRHTMSTV